MQNIISVEFSAEDLAAIDAAVAVLEQKFAVLQSLTPEERLHLNKMGDRSEPFCRLAMQLMTQNPGILPPLFNLAEAQRDMRTLEALRPLFSRLRVLMVKAEDAETALGSDVLSASLEGYGLLRISGKGQGLDALREAMSARFARRPRTPRNGNGGGSDGGGSSAA